jgi:hypothetical protein
MQTFRDNAGRTWTVAVDVAAVKRVRSVLNVDLLEYVDGSLLQRLAVDPVLLCDVLYVVCKPEADRLGVSDEDFGRAMGGDVIEHATRAFMEALVSFSPNPRDRANLKRVLNAMDNTMEKARDIVTRRLDEKLDEVMSTALRGVGASSLNSQAL